MNEDFFKDILAKLGLFEISKKLFGKYLYKYKNYKFKKEAIKGLIAFKNVLDTEKIEYWLEFGTLLGAIRDKDFIKHDFDIDFGCFPFEKSKNFKNILQKNNFKLIRKVYLKNKNILSEETYNYKDKFNIDLFYFYTENDKYIFYDFSGKENLSFNETIKKLGGLLCYKNTINKFKLKKYNFKNIEFNIPEDYKKHLSELYGNNFMIYNPNWKLSDRKIRSIVKDEIGNVKGDIK